MSKSRTPAPGGAPSDLPEHPPTPSMAPIPLSNRIDPTAVGALLAMSLGRLIRGQRLLILVVLFLLPLGLALLARYLEGASFDPVDAEEWLIFYMIPQALVPITALILASGMVSDEVEEQTLTYLLIRPVPKAVIYLVKLLATILVAGGLTFVFTAATLAAIHWGGPDFWRAIAADRAPRIAGLLALSTVAYGSLFGLLSLVVRRSLTLGVAYIVLFEGVLANIDFVVRRATVMYHVRILAERWLGLHVESWSIDLETAPGGTEALLSLLVASAVAVGTAAWLFSIREFRVKTPEGS